MKGTTWVGLYSSEKLVINELTSSKGFVTANGVEKKRLLTKSKIHENIENKKRGDTVNNVKNDPVQPRETISSLFCGVVEIFSN